MKILLAFVPFLTFAIVDQILGPSEGLLAAAGVSFILVLGEVFAGRAPKILEIGSVVLFGGLAVYGLAAGHDWSLLGARLSVDIGILAIVLLSMAIGRPFTLQYAREQVEPAIWDSPVFRRVNMVITAVWALAFTVTVVCDLLMIYVPEIPMRVDVIASILAIVAAVKFTTDYPKSVSAAR